MKYYAIKNEVGEFRYDLLSNNYEQILKDAAELAFEYLESGSDEEGYESYSDEELVSTVNWEIVEISKNNYDYLFNIDGSSVQGNYITIY